MKKIILIPILICLLGVFSCKDDFLQKDNPNGIPSSQFWKTEADATAAVTSCYACLLFEGNFSKWWMWSNESRSDLGYCQSDWGGFATYAKFNYDNNDFELIRYMWQSMYTTIYHCNSVLTYVPQITMNETLRKRYYGEVKFIRGMMYFHLVTQYGRAVIVTEPSTTATEKPSNQDPDQINKIYDFVEQDLRDAVYNSGIPWKNASKDKGRVTQGAARALLAKVYMQRHKWDSAYVHLNAIVDGNKGGYSLVSNWRDNFGDEKEFNTESVFEITYDGKTPGSPGWDSPKSGTTSQYAQYLAPRKIGGHSDLQPTYYWLTQFSDTTEAVDTGRWACYSNTDPRRDWSIFWRFNPKLVRGTTEYDTYQQLWYTKDGKYFGAKSDTLSNPVLSIDTNRTNGVPYRVIWSMKYTNGYKADRAYEDYKSSINWRYIRYADVLLLYAEVLNELGRTSEAYSFVDQVRQRVGVVKLSVINPSLNIDDMRKQIEHERIVELGNEGWRWFDLVRYGYLDSDAGIAELQKHDFEFRGSSNGHPFRKGLDNYLPIPKHDVDLDANLKQNEGF